MFAAPGRAYFVVVLLLGGRLIPRQYFIGDVSGLGMVVSPPESPRLSTLGFTCHYAAAFAQAGSGLAQPQLRSAHCGLHEATISHRNSLLLTREPQSRPPPPQPGVPNLSCIFTIAPTNNLMARSCDDETNMSKRDRKC